MLKFVQSELPPAPSIELNKTVDEQYEVKFDQSLQEVQLVNVVSQLPKDVQKKLDGKMISYYDQDYQSYVYLGCIKDDPQIAVQANRQIFNPDKIKGCQSALGSNS